MGWYSIDIGVTKNEPMVHSVWWGLISQVLTMYKENTKNRLIDICDFDGII